MMPKSENGVVNERLVVYGTRNLRVVDASIMPMHVQGNIIVVVDDGSGIQGLGEVYIHGRCTDDNNYEPCLCDSREGCRFD
jgi:hypothetical protein